MTASCLTHSMIRGSRAYQRPQSGRWVIQYVLINERTMDRRYPTALLLALAMLGAPGCSSESDGSVGDQPLAYPSGPYGFEQDDVIANITLRTAEGEPVTLGSFQQGSVRAVLLYVTATWCFTCGPEIGWLNSYGPRLDGDLASMSVLLQNQAFEDATAEDAIEFGEGYGSEFSTLLDPDGELDVFREEAFIPLNILVDTSTMRITLRKTGFDEPLLDGAIRAIIASE